jgi:hypothetical protein
VAGTADSGLVYARCWGADRLLDLVRRTHQWYAGKYDSGRSSTVRATRPPEDVRVELLLDLVDDLRVMVAAHPGGTDAATDVMLFI